MTEKPLMSGKFSDVGGIILGSQQKKAGSPHISLVCEIKFRNNN